MRSKRSCSMSEIAFQTATSVARSPIFIANLNQFLAFFLFFIYESFLPAAEISGNVPRIGSCEGDIHQSRRVFRIIQACKDSLAIGLLGSCWEAVAWDKRVTRNTV